MGTTGNQSVTISAVERTYVPSWASQYANDLKAGNTATKKAALTGGSSILRIKHDASKGIERHIVSIEDRYADPDETSGERIQKMQVTLTCNQDDATEEAALVALATGMLTWLQTAGILDSVVADEL